MLPDHILRACSSVPDWQKNFQRNEMENLGFSMQYGGCFSEKATNMHKHT